MNSRLEKKSAHPRNHLSSKYERKLTIPNPRRLAQDFRMEDFLRVARTGLVNTTIEEKTPDGFSKVSTKTIINEDVRSVLRTMYSAFLGPSGSKKRLIAPVALTGSITSSGAGVGVLNGLCDPTGYSNWSAFAAIFDEFRVVGGALQVLSGYVNSIDATPAHGSAIYAGPAYACFDNDGTPSPLPSTIVQYPHYVVGNMHPAANKGVFEFKFKRPDLDVYSFIATNAPTASLGSVLFYCLGPVSVTFFHSYVMMLHIEFVGMK